MRLSAADYVYSVSQNIAPPLRFSDIFPNGCEFLVQILHTYYTFLSTKEYKFLFNCHIKRDHHHMLKMTTSGRNER